MSKKLKALGLLVVFLLLAAGIIELFFSNIQIMKIIEMLLVAVAAIVGFFIFGNKKNYQQK